jgi:NAD(P)H dehydrogenase (quinone)
MVGLFLSRRASKTVETFKSDTSSAKLAVGIFLLTGFIYCEMRVFIVHAHHEPNSFNGAITREAVAALNSAVHSVVVSDLYAMVFNPVSDRRNFTTTADAEYLRQQAEEIHATENDGFAPDIKAEMEKLFWCDALIFQFPLWWFGLPAILKGWVDRIFAMRRIYGGGRYYDRGVFAGRRAMCSLTTGGGGPSYSARGLSGELSSVLFPIHHGIFYFTGFTVIEPFVVHAPVRISQQERAAHLARYREHVLTLSSAPTISYPKLEDYDEQSVLKFAASDDRRNLGCCP